MWDVEAFTEEWPPLNYTVGGVAHGISVELLERVCERLGWRCKITVASWARAVLEAKGHKNGLVFTTARTPDREAEFLWVGPLMPREVWLFGQKACADDPARWSGARIGVLPNNAAHKDLTRLGYPKESFDNAPNNESNYKKLARGRVDCMGDNEISVTWGFHQLHLGDPPPKRVRLSSDGAYYYALNLEFDSSKARAFQAALDKLREEGSFQEIFNRNLK
ncbi:MAG: ABC transporter substrate-binding protein [Paucibacter sp.]|nr:ABC transporter substrate-binding protein [Roseateles sp.]